MSSSDSEATVGLVMVVLFVLFLGCTSCVSISKPSDGERVGTLAKISKKGWIWETWEGELRVSGSVAEPWEFSVKDKNVIDFLNANIGKEIKLQYHQGIVWAWDGETSYMATSATKTNQ